MPCFSSVPDENWIAARVRALYAEPFRTMLLATITALENQGLVPAPVLMRWQSDASAAQASPLREREEIDWLVSQPRYQRGYSNGNLAATLLCASLWRLLEAGGAVPSVCSSWWDAHLERDRLLNDDEEPKPARLPDDIEVMYSREKQLFEEIWLKPNG
ncbi:hypothetical protein [Arenimonas composti]|uniref:Uncharacterized protein n=1 Tax=Arenimonas composti TR7-09 = DSM 18010 TaxID=1121013 RepID=A0A091C2C7_9GAMM|nr:hypothetical protein [Arenimonas composti]KFN50785.1 hypothetical protein P873_05185 [Arenimonas composti TR7-09 = DSM 18010]